MDKIVPELYRDYGNYVNFFRALPLEIDGLKPAERRILLSAYEIARDHTIKSYKIDSYCCSEYHPHGSAYGTLVQLVRRGLLDPQGNFGITYGIDHEPAASPRYTEAKLSHFSNENIFKYIKHVDREVLEIDPEPPYLPTKYPLCFIGNNYVMGIAFGYKTMSPCFTVEDLKKRLMFLLGKGKKTTIKPITDCQILSSDKDIETLLTTGTLSMSVRGIYKTESHHHKVIVKSWPGEFDSLFKQIKSKFGDDVGYTDLSAKGNTEVLFEVMRQRGKEEIYKSFIKALPKFLEGNINFDNNIVDRFFKVKRLSVDEMLLTTYRMYKDVNKKMLNSEIKKIDDYISECMVIDKIKKVLPKYLQVKKIDIAKVSAEIAQSCKEDLSVIKSIMQRYSINSLLSTENNIKEASDKRKEFEKNLKNLEAFVIQQY